jgi:signal transduction histidine kinase/ActR/RegA family two-component response regulator
MTPSAIGGSLEQRVLVFAPVGRDGELTRQLLEQAGVSCAVQASVSALIQTLATDGGAALIMTEEALDDPAISALLAALNQQSTWSDLPILLCAGGPWEDMSLRAIRSLETLRNVTLLERPIRLAAVLSAVRAALRSRVRQYEVRDLLVALDRARAEAESANRLKDEFLATLSHELRTPLNAIIGWTSMLAHGQVDPERLPRVFEALDRNAQAQAQLIADVLDVSRIVTGKLQLQPTVVDICDTVMQAADAVRPAAGAKDIRLTFELPPNCHVRGDAARLLQIFWNLLSNAVKFTPPGGTVRIDVRRADDMVQVSVSDSGPGIPAEFVPFVFDRFRQADQSSTRVHGGLGLGLSIVKHLVELHGGSVRASSADPGPGARFDVCLHALDWGTVTEPPEVSRQAVDLVGRLILVVDDDQSTREVVAAALEAAHADVRIASSADEARQRLCEETPALIIADLGMPGEDGFAFIHALRGSAARDVPAIALSAYADAGSREAALAAGFTGFIAKPTRPRALVEMAESLLKHSADACR